eukprot:475836-Pelagomonas_calceolata.AAC.1
MVPNRQVQRMTACPTCVALSSCAARSSSIATATGSNSLPPAGLWPPSAELSWGKACPRLAAARIVAQASTCITEQGAPTSATTERRDA